MRVRLCRPCRVAPTLPQARRRCCVATFLLNRCRKHELVSQILNRCRRPGTGVVSLGSTAGPCPEDKNTPPLVKKLVCVWVRGRVSTS
eukprot:91318-Alexandrium_andersonii.AAC.1